MRRKEGEEEKVREEDMVMEGEEGGRMSRRKDRR